MVTSCTQSCLLEPLKHEGWSDDDNRLWQIISISCERSPKSGSVVGGFRHDGTQSEQGKALEAWWEQWVMVEWPEGPLPSGFHSVSFSLSFNVKL